MGQRMYPVPAFSWVDDMAKKDKRRGKLTKKQLARRRRERRQMIAIWGSLGLIALAVVGILAAGLIAPGYKVVAEVNGQKIRVGEYQKRVRFWYHYYNNRLMQGALDNLDEKKRNEFYRGIADDLIKEALVRQEAAKRGLTVSDDEVQIEIEERWFRHYRVPPTPTTVPTADPNATPTPESTPRPTPTPDTEEAFQKNYQEFVEQVLKPAGLNEAYFRRLVEYMVLEKKLAEAVITDVPTEEEQVYIRYTMVRDEETARAKIAALEEGVEDQVHVRHILVNSEEEAQKVIERLKAGEDFARLAAELSQDKGTKDEGGDLGWFGRGKMDPDFEKAAFEGEVGLYPKPVKTRFGYHVIEILGREKRPIDPDKELFELGWMNKEELASRFGDTFAAIVFDAGRGLITAPVPTDTGVAVVEVIEHEVRALDEQAREQRRSEMFRKWLDEVRQEGEVQNFWTPDMVPSKM